MNLLVLLRHGESVWNSENRFTGWTDIELSEKGVNQAHEAGRLIKNEGFVFDAAYTSLLKRAIDTLNIALDESGLHWIPVEKSWRLNERHYGDLQGMNKEETALKYGKEQVHRWRRGYMDRPPAVSKEDSRWPGHDARYIKIPQGDLPLTESLNDVLIRLLPIWEGTIRPALSSGMRILVSAHGNSIRSLIKHLQGLDDEQIENVDVPTGIPLVYEMNDSLNPVDIYYLGEHEKIDAAYR